MQERSNSGIIEGAEEDMEIKGTAEMPKQEAEIGLEELFAQAEALIGRLEEPGLPLEEAFLAYEQGMRIIRQCNQKIDLVEEKMMVMNEEGVLTPFETAQR